MTIIPPHDLFQQAFSLTHIIQVEYIDPFTLPSVDLEQRDQLPRVNAIYFAIINTEILYIGKSVNLHQRWHSHHRTNQLQSYGNVAIAWLHLTNLEQDLDELEEKCISHFKPSLNGTVTPDTDDHRLQKLLGNRIKQLREQRRWTQQQLAMRVEIKDSRHIRRWESGDHFPGAEQLEAIAKAFSIRMRDLFVFPDEPDF